MYTKIKRGSAKETLKNLKTLLNIVNKFFSLLLVSLVQVAQDFRFFRKLKENTKVNSPSMWNGNLKKGILGFNRMHRE